ncbi:CAIB/BAIF family protein [Nitrincola lacisaponensis]|uniref:CAIB/BAIF family protein n=1 Tax=Nitrincola lacisaponensis TaxID=267850 RepID=A0A063Y4C0_9GAMM|nr:CaiB/BaiF CoA-transferase family protein [Nitrincola lacisaponensis]KDE41188.1 CAIB/BAIF family protein [Nitrincola lacisaponensis]
MPAQPLQGIRVLDLSRILAGPWCSQQLADLGAEVIKIERPGEGDDTRRWGPPWLETSREAAYYLGANRGKQSVTVDMANPEGQALLHQLVQSCDVVLENFKVGGLKKYRLDYDSLKTLKPDLIYCSITGFGQDGPYAQRAGYDFMIQGMGGLMSLTGQPDSEPGGGPVKVGVAFADIFTGMYAANAIMAALLQRQRTGEGTYIDLALLDVQVGVLANQALNYLTSGDVPQRLGNAHPNIVPYQAFATRDGHLILAVGNDGQFRRFCETAGCVELADDPRFQTNALRVQHRAELIPLLLEPLRQKTTDEWLLALEQVGVPCGPINTLDRVFEDPQVKHRGLKITRPHPQDGEVQLVSNPIRFNGEALNAPTAPPLLGEHTDAVLSRCLNLTPEALVSLKEKGVI